LTVHDPGPLDLGGGKLKKTVIFWENGHFLKKTAISWKNGHFRVKTGILVTVFDL
jgi:hypothetical protein